MRLAIVVSAAYKKSSQLPKLAPALIDAQVLGERLAEHDAGYVVETVAADAKLASRLERRLESARRANGKLSLVLYVSGYVMTDEDGHASLLLDARRGGSLPLERVRTWIERASSDALVVIDAAHAPANEDVTASAEIVAAMRDAFAPKRSGISALLGARPWDRTPPRGPSLLTRLLLLALERDGRALTASEAYAAMRADTERFHEIPAMGFFGGQHDVQLLRARIASLPETREDKSEPEHDAPAAASDRRREASREDERARHERAISESKRALLEFGSRRTPERAELYVKIARAKRALGSSAEAILNFDKALSIDPLHPGVLEQAAELLRAERDFAHLDRLYRRRLEALGSDEERARAWRELALLWQNEAGDPKQAAAALEHWLGVAPGSVEALERLVNVEAGLGRHAAALGARRRLAAALADQPEKRAGVLSEAARDAERHLPNKNEAVELARAALAVDPGALEALEVAANVLGKRRRFGELAELYESVLERTRDAALGWDLSKRLGLMRRDELGDARGARDAFRRALEHNSADPELHLWLADLEQSDGEFARATEHVRAAAALEPGRSETFRRALGLFQKTGQADSAWNAACVLELVGAADINESLLADAHRLEGLPAAETHLSDEDWHAGLVYPERDAELGAVLAAVSRAAIAVAIERLRGKGRLARLDQALRQDAERSTATLTRSLVWTARLLGVPRPALYITPDAPDRLAPAPSEAPSVVANKSLSQGFALPELAFLWGRTLTYFRPEHYLLSFYPSLRDLGAVLLSALSFGGDVAAEVGSMEGEAQQLVARLSEVLEPDERDALKRACRAFDVKNTRRRIVAWARSVHLSAGRAGLIACGDVRLAAELTRRFVLPGDLDAHAAVADLCAYAVSRSYADVRERLGVCVAG
jgi:tetratricopeptide (TPR) repeat protein